MILQEIRKKEPVNKGWSGDKKFHIWDSTGNEYLLRISPPERQAKVSAQFQRMLQAADLGIPMCLPIECGTCSDGAYAVHSWVHGLDLEDALPTLSHRAQYTYGLDAGKILKKLHSLPAPGNAEDWALRFNRKIDRKIAMYEACPLKYENGDAFLRHIAASRHPLSKRPQTYQHGDYHVGNMMLDQTGLLTIIDFDRDDWGDPWEEFNRIVWCAQASAAFASGMVDGYFQGPVPQEFWDLLALYICSNTLSSLPWAIPFGESQIHVMRDQAAEILLWYRNMETTIPSWYVPVSGE